MYDAEKIKKSCCFLLQSYYPQHIFQMERKIPDAGGNVCKTEKSGYADRTVPKGSP
jgi:hypothetical protein